MGKPDFIKGARFIDTSRDIDRDNWPRDPSLYKPSNRFAQRFKELSGIVRGSDITEAFRYGFLYPAKQNCVTFVSDLGGVAIYPIVTDDTIAGVSMEVRDLTMVTLWAHVHDREEAWNTGRWTGVQLNAIDQMEPDDSWTE